MEISETKIKPLHLLSRFAKREVIYQLDKLPNNFKFQGYVKITYADQAIVNIQPIEGTSIDYMQNTFKNIGIVE